MFDESFVKTGRPCLARFIGVYLVMSSLLAVVHDAAANPHITSHPLAVDFNFQNSAIHFV
jgi:hypothetical protein